MPKNGHILEILPNRTKASIKQSIQTLSEWKNIKCYTMDMWNPYKKAVYELDPNAIIIAVSDVVAVFAKICYIGNIFKPFSSSATGGKLARVL